MAISRKTVITLALVVVIVFWAFDTIRTRSFSGSNLTFTVEKGIVTITNPSDEAVPVQLQGTGTRPFTVTSTIDGVEGDSVRGASGPDSTQLFDFVLPAGSSEFSVVRGSNVSFTATSDTNLQAILNPLTVDMTRVALITAGFVILVVLLFGFGSLAFNWVKTTLRPNRVRATA